MLKFDRFLTTQFESIIMHDAKKKIFKHAEKFLIYELYVRIIGIAQ